MDKRSTPGGVWRVASTLALRAGKAVDQALARLAEEVLLVGKLMVGIRFIRERVASRPINAKAPP
jgi:hypothetical protein